MAGEIVVGPELGVLLARQRLVVVPAVAGHDLVGQVLGEIGGVANQISWHNCVNMTTTASHHSRNDSEGLSPDERERLRRCLFHALWGSKFWTDRTDDQFYKAMGISRNNVAYAMDNWYRPVEDKITTRVIENVVPKLLSRVSPLDRELSDSEKEEWNNCIGALPEEVRSIFIKWQRSAVGRISRQSQFASALLAFVRSNPAFVITAVYLYLSIFGLTYTWSLYSRFGINLLDFATAEDFFLAAFKFPLALVSALIGIGTGIYLWLKTYERYPRLTARQRVIQIVTFCVGFTVWLFGPPFQGATIMEAQIRDGQSGLVWVRLKPSDSFASCGIADSPVAIIGRTGGHMFFYQPRSGCVAAIAMNQVSGLEFDAMQKMEEPKGNEE